MKIVWIGCHSEGLVAFRRMLESGRRVERFITLDNGAFSRRSAGTRDYEELCRTYGVPVSFVSSIKTEEAYQIVREAAPDLLVVLGWSEILPGRLLELPATGTVGAHASLLPHGRGSAPVNWALIRGETEGGNSLMWLDKEVDRGEIIDQVPFPITVYDTCKTLYDKVSSANAEMILRLVERLDEGQGTVLRKRNETTEPLLPRRHPADGLLNWDQPARRVYDFIRALTRPYPGAFTALDGKRYFVWSASLLPGKEPHSQPGEVLGSAYSPLEDACGIQVACREGSVVLHELEDGEGCLLRGAALSGAGLTGIFEGG